MTPPTPQLDAAAVRRSLENPARFSEILCGEPLWPHQRAVAESEARYRVICAGRQAGKSRLLAVLALHAAFTRPRSRVLIVSAGEVAAQRLLAEIAQLAGSELLAGSVVDETKSSVTLTTGSEILSVPASSRQIRGWSIDLLILDEAGFIDHELWRAAEPVIIARPGSRVILTSTPWGGTDHFFRQQWQRGMDRPDGRVESWHWPSSVSPLVDTDLLAEIEARETADYFRREYLAEWTDETGSFLSEAEISGAVADYPLLDPGSVLARMPWNREIGRRVQSFTAAAGVDWGFSNDAQAVVLVSALNDGGLNGAGLVYFLPWLEFRYRCSYDTWITRLAELGRAWRLPVVAAETNGVGAYPTEDLRTRMYEAGTGSAVCPVWTDVRRKQSGFGKVKTLLQQGRLVLPRYPELLKQLRALEFEQLQGGSVRISVPERAGHDDLAMALMQAVSCVRPGPRRPDEVPDRELLPHTTTGSGIRVPEQALPVEWHLESFVRPTGGEKRVESAW